MEHFRRWEQFMQYMVTHGYTYVHLCKTYDMYANALTKVEAASLCLHQVQALHYESLMHHIYV